MAFFSLGVAMSDDQASNESQDKDSHDEVGSDDNQQSATEGAESK